uniref:DDE Tnp4 domain-containing protein n=1 Tax=Amphimedon queenslandica TaxID=400682 RepID=A0A1X7UIW8_AMPQE
LWDVLSGEYLKPPGSNEEWKRIIDGSCQAWILPHCIGAIDGKHVVMQAPANSGSQYYNYKGTHSIVLLAVCDYNYCFTLLDIGNYGRQSDGRVFSNSLLGQAMESNTLSIPEPVLSQICVHMPYFFVADCAFPLKTYILTPYPGSYLPENKRIFKYWLSRARCVIENAFGILATKFRIFRRPIIAKVEKVTRITQAACVLHNYLKILEMHCPVSARLYCPPGFVDQEDTKEVQEYMTAYVNSIGAVPWQKDHIHST